MVAVTAGAGAVVIVVAIIVSSLELLNKPDPLFIQPDTVLILQ